MKHIVWLKISLLAILGGCIPCFQSEMPVQGVRSETELDLARLVSANKPDTPLINALEGNCPVNEIEIPGQGSRVRGGIGGLAIFPNPVDASSASIRTFDPLKVGRQMSTPTELTPTEPAAVIIVDDFNGDIRQPGVYFLDQQEGPTLADLKSGATETDVAALETNRQYSHGALVFNHTLALLSAEDANPEFSYISIFIPDSERVISVPIVTFTKLNVVVVALDTQDFNTEVIGGRLQATIQTIATTQALTRQQIRRFAVNLSFGLVPCSVLADIKAAKQSDLTFEAYRDEVLDANGLDANQFREALVNILTTPVNIDSDPLLTDVARNRDLNGRLEISYLAASGNYALPYSLYPGYWPEFVSVSAQNLADTSAPAVRDPDYSDTGEVLVPGGYFMLTAYDPETKAFRTYPQISIAGTSFAAPVLSVFTVLDFTGATPRCARVSPSVTSPLAFFKTDPPVALPIPDLNLALGDALSKYCR